MQPEEVSFLSYCYTTTTPGTLFFLYRVSVLQAGLELTMVAKNDLGFFIFLLLPFKC